MGTTALYLPGITPSLLVLSCNIQWGLGGIRMMINRQGQNPEFAEGG